MNLENKVAIVTGASRGIGLAITQALLQEGVKVAGWSRNAPEELTHGHFHHVEVDLTKESSVQQAYEQTVNELGQDIAILINNAGLGYRGNLEDTPTEKWKYLFDLNVHGLFYATRLVLPQMKTKEEGHIINVSSGAGTNGIAGMTCYCATKHAVVGISHALHQEVRDFGIKVTCLSPGSVQTRFAQNSGRPPSKKNSLMPEDLAASVVHTLKCPQNFHYTDLEVRPLQPNKGVE